MEQIHQCAALLLDLQVDFLACAGARLPVSPADAARVIESANSVLAGSALAGCLPVLIVNQFAPTAWVANLFRRSAAIKGTPGAALDPRIQATDTARVFAKQRPSAFSNPDLEPYLRAHNVSKVYVLGVYAEGCVRATATAARQRGFIVEVPLAGIGTNSEFKRRFAQWAMRRAGVKLVPALTPSANAT